MASKPKFNPALHDENPEWTAEMFARAKPAREVLSPELLSQFKSKVGRPRLENPKTPVKLRLDADVVAALRSSGAGWQSRINSLLRSKLKGDKIVIATMPDKPKQKTSSVDRAAKRKRA